MERVSEACMLKQLGSVLLLGYTITTSAPAAVVFLTSPNSPIDTVNWAQLGADGTLLSQNFAATSGLGVSVAGSFNGVGGGLTSVVCNPGNPVNCSWAPPAPG